MAWEEILVQVFRFLQFWRNWVVIVASRCHTFVFDASADFKEKIENRTHCITSNGGTASPSDATSSGEGEWEEITTALTAKPSASRELQISSNIDPAGEFKVPIALADEASQPADAAATAPSLWQTSPPRRSLEDSKEQGIITAQRTLKPAVQDVRFGKEVLVVNTSFVNIKPDQIESLNKDHEVDALYDDLFRKFRKPELDYDAAGGLPMEAKPFKGPVHVPPSVSEGSVSTFAMHVDKTKTTLVPRLEMRRTAAGEGAEVLAKLKQTSPTQKILPMENDSTDSLSRCSSTSSSFM